MIEIIQIPVESHDTKRLLERIIRYNDELFVFLDNLKVEPLPLFLNLTLADISFIDKTIRIRGP